jgi:hypothetical protein
LQVPPNSFIHTQSSFPIEQQSTVVLDARNRATATMARRGAGSWLIEVRRRDFNRPAW